MADNNSLINYGNLTAYHNKSMELLNSTKATLQEQIDNLLERLKVLEEASVAIVETDSTE